MYPNGDCILKTLMYLTTIYNRSKLDSLIVLSIKKGKQMRTVKFRSKNLKLVTIMYLQPTVRLREAYNGVLRIKLNLGKMC